MCEWSGGIVQNWKVHTNLYRGSFSQVWRIIDIDESDPNVTKIP